MNEKTRAQLIERITKTLDPEHVDPLDDHLETMVAQLVAVGVVYISKQPYCAIGPKQWPLSEQGSSMTAGLVVICDELFWWAQGTDDEPVTYDEIPSVYRAWLGGKVNRWCCLHRKMRPPDADRGFHAPERRVGRRARGVAVSRPEGLRMKRWALCAVIARRAGARSPRDRRRAPRS